jgi:hypothetical protein
VLLKRLRVSQRNHSGFSLQLGSVTENNSWGFISGLFLIRLPVIAIITVASTVDIDI